MKLLIIFGTIYCIFVAIQIGDSMKDNQPNHSSGSSGSYHRKSPRTKEESESTETYEDDAPVSPPEITAMKGLASAGISYIRPSGSIQKCLGQDMRVEKVIQVTRHCEEETGEGNETLSQGRSLCFTACMYRWMGLIGEDLHFTSNIGTVVVDIFPAIAHPQAKKAFRSCAKQSSLPFSTADNCTSFGHLKSCILRNVQNICNGDYY